LEEFDAKLAELNLAEVELAKLSWEVSLTEGDFLRAAELRNKAKQIAELDRGTVSEISVVQPATLGLKKVKPRRSIMALLAIGLALGIGFGQALIRGLMADPDGSVESENSASWEIPGSQLSGRASQAGSADQVSDLGIGGAAVDEGSFTSLPR
ncbi:MAG: GNVR domain-containing protein, partial [Planctomycetota bacterium]